MGAFYGSIQVRTSDREGVRAGVEEIAKARGIRCLVGPAIDGWVGVYPSGNGQDNHIGAAIAARVGGQALHFLVHDDGITAYWFYENGKLLDAYWSRPGYFDGKDQAEQEAMCGRPEILVGSDSPVLSQILAVLQRDVGARLNPSESRRLEKLAKLLGVTNALTAYEYSRDGETKGIEGWKKFVEVPAEAISAEKPKALALRREKNQLKRQGLLLVEQNRDVRHRLAWCAVGNAFWLLWRRGVDGLTIEQHAMPSAQPSGELNLALAGEVDHILASDSGRYVAIGEWVHDDRSGWREVGIWDVNQGAWLWRKRGDPPCGFDGREERLILRGREKFEAVLMADGRKLIEFEVDTGGLNCRVHPNGREILINRQTQVFLVDLAEPPSARWLDWGGNLRVSRIEFSRDGQWLFCGTDSGLVVYRWHELKDSGKAAWRYVSSANQYWPGYQVHAVAEDVQRNEVVFGGNDEWIRTFALQSGNVTNVLKLPGDIQAVEIKLTKDGQGMGLIVQSTLPWSQRNRHNDTHWQMWNYAKLREHAMA